MTEETYVIGTDFGSDSVRAVIVETATGKIIGTGVSCYPRWKEGRYQHPEQAIFRQHPLDYLESFEQCVTEALSFLSVEQRSRVSGIGIDTTGSTPAPVNREGIPLALLDEFAENENAMFYLWKDHSAWREAQELNGVFSEEGHPNYCKYMGTYSAEWYWAKILHGIRTDQSIREAAYFWVEHCDWMVGILCGNTKPETMYHNSCAAGYKALWHSEWGGLPEKEVLAEADPYLALIHERYGTSPKPATVCAGHLTAEWAKRLGLSEKVCVSGCSFDAHAGAVGAGITPGTMVCTIGTSAVDMLVVEPEELLNKDITRFAGSAENAILPGYVGIETGQAAFGDLFAWFKKLLMWPLTGLEQILHGETYTEVFHALEERLFVNLETGSKDIPEEELPVILDWFNGRRYPDTDDFQRGTITNLSLGTSAPQIYRALVFSAVAGLHRICNGFRQEGLKINRILAVGGISKKSGYIMQMMADLLNKEISILDSDQTCALGAAIYAAIGSGCFEDIQVALDHMSAKETLRYIPDRFHHEKYLYQYERYLALAEKMG